MGVQNQVQLGPWGSSGGEYPYEFIPNGRITKIVIKCAGCIDSIQFAYIDANTGEERWSDKYGGDGGTLQNTLCIGPNEELINVSGTVGKYNEWTVIKSLYFKTNKQKCEFGSPTSDKFTLPLNIKTGKFAGFHGRYGVFLTRLVYSSRPSDTYACMHG